MPRASMALLAGDTLEIYLATGKRKHPRVFWIQMKGPCVCWGKSRDARRFKQEALRSIEDVPRIQTARELFDAVDTDGSGELDRDELQLLYRQARGEKLGKKDIAAAMAEMDSDGDGTISFAEFETWWGANGGDLEVHRDRAMTIGAGDLLLLLVAPDSETKARWIAGCRELLGIAAPAPETRPAPAPALDATAERAPASALPAPPARVRLDGRRVPALPMLVVPAKAARDALFNALDVNGNGGLSLAEIDKGVVSGIFTKALSPEGSEGGESFDHKPALMRAYHAADRSQDGFIERSEFALLLQYMVYFNNLWHRFEAIDSDHDRRLDLGEFTTGCEMLGLEISAEEAEAEFMRCDADGGGLILFGEFCAWCAARHVGGMALSSEQMQREVVDTAIPRLNQNIAAVGGDVTRTVDAIRDALTMRWKSLSNGSRGKDKLNKLFSVLDEDNSGALRLAEFSTAIRRAGQITPQMVSDDEIQTLFEAIDVSQNGAVTLDGLSACIWGSNDGDVAPEPESESRPGPHLEIPPRGTPSPVSNRKKKKNKKSNKHLPWQDSKLAERTDAKRPSVEQQQRKQSGSVGARLPSKMRPISASTAYSPRSTPASQGTETGQQQSQSNEASDKANACRRVRANRMTAHKPRPTVYHLEKEPHAYWSQVKTEQIRRAAERGYATSEASFATADSPARGTEMASKLTWQSPSGNVDKWHLGLSTLDPDDLPPKEQFDNASRSPARPTPSSGFGQKTTPNRAPLARSGTPIEAEELAAGTRIEEGAEVLEASIRSSSPTSNADGLGLRRLSSAAGMGSPRERELTRRLNDNASTSQERDEIRRQRLSVREKLVNTWKSLSYTENGQDPAKLFRRFDKDKNGVIDELEFRNAVRKGGQITASMMSDERILRLFQAIDTGGNGSLTEEELTSFLWGSNATVALYTPTASPSSSRCASPDQFAPPGLFTSAMQEQH